MILIIFEKYKIKIKIFYVTCQARLNTLHGSGIAAPATVATGPYALPQTWKHYSTISPNCTPSFNAFAIWTSSVLAYVTPYPDQIQTTKVCCPSRRTIATNHIPAATCGPITRQVMWHRCWSQQEPRFGIIKGCHDSLDPGIP